MAFCRRAINYTAQWRSAQCPSGTMQAPPALSQSRVLKTPGRGMGVLRTANASGAPGIAVQ